MPANHPDLVRLPGPEGDMAFPQLRNPIVLVHGLMGFDALRIGRMRLRGYFPGIEEGMRAAGNRVFCPKLSPTASVAHRAAQLRTYLNQVSPTERVHIIAHSMGGLDARYMVSRLDMADRVHSLTTIATPHRGSPVADWGTKRFGRLGRPMFRFFGMPDQAFFDLTTEGCRAFNAEAPDIESVRYFSVAGQCSLAWLGPEWLIPHEIVRRAEGPNDGMVSVASATWGEQIDIWPGDHVSLINWPNLLALSLGIWRCRRREYAGLLNRLVEIGF
jgi:triacylglycerol lipase